MALISCPKCEKQISETAPACPHCGYQLSDASIADAPVPTKIGEIKINYKAGCFTIICGILLIPIALLSLLSYVIPGLICLGVSLGLIGTGIQKIMGTRSISCPYCGTPTEVSKNFKNYKCDACKKRSVRKDDYLHPVM